MASVEEQAQIVFWITIALNGSSVIPTDVNLVVNDPNPSDGVTLNPDGTVTVAPSTPAGSYPIDYSICEVLNSSNCSVATVTITVGSATIVANDDSPAQINGISGGTSPDSVLDNDALNGSSVIPADVNLVVNDPNPSDGVTLNPDGTVTVAPSTPAGSYPIDYSICEVLNSSNCSVATVTITVGSATIVANDDSPAQINGISGGTSPDSVLDNDSLNGSSVIPTDVNLVVNDPNPSDGVTLNPDGTVTVAPSTPAGSFPIDYSICEVLNSSNCSVATVTITVGSATIVANDDFPAAINGNIGGTIPDSVLDNDTLNGSTVVPATVTLMVNDPNTADGVTLNPDGTVTVASGTPAGNYPIEYTICENMNSTNCSTAITTVTVDSVLIIANNDSPVSINGTGGTSTLNILSNDTINGAPANLGNITVTINDPNGMDGVAINSNGMITVNSGTPAGVYVIEYIICDSLNSSNCDNATVIITVRSTPIEAIQDTLTPINGSAGGTSSESVLSNDTLNGNIVDPNDITLTINDSDLSDGVSLNSNGTVTVDSGTPAGSYSISYTICQSLNPSNCSTTTVNIIVETTPIEANNDTPESINGLNGGVLPINILANDTLDGSLVDLTDITITVNDPNTGDGVSVNTDGTIVVKPNTQAGTYVIEYQICESASPANCDTASVTVIVDASIIEANTDTFTAINGSTGGISEENILTNDTLNGNSVNPEDITLTINDSVPTDGITLNPDGTVTIAPNTPAGSYSIEYTICENLNLTNCSTATVTIVATVNLPPIAVDDELTEQPLGQAVIVKVVENDSDPEDQLDPSSVRIIDPTGGDLVTTLNVNGEGIWTVNTTSGDITFTPEIGFVGDPTIIGYTVKDTSGLESNQAFVKVDYEETASLMGTVWVDRDKDGQVDPNEDRKPGWTLVIRDINGDVVTTTRTDSNGEYLVTGLIPAEYTIDFINTNGVLISSASTNGQLVSGETLNLPLPIDPSGVVYDSTTRLPLGNVRLQLLNSQGGLVSDACLGEGQQNQVTTVDGLYAFDVTPSADASCPNSGVYSLNIATVPVGYFTDSTIIAPQTGIFDSDSNEQNCTVDRIANSGSCEVQAQPDAPQSNQDTTYFMDFLLNSGDSNIIFNHIPLDAQTSRHTEIADNAILLEKVANKKQASVADQVYYTIRAENTTEDDLEVDIVDDLPTGFKFVASAAKLTRAGADGRFGTVDDVFSTVRASGHDPVRFGSITLQAAEKIQLGYILKVGTGVRQGKAVNTAQSFATGSSSDIASNVATAQVAIIADPVLDQSSLIGKVFHDRNGNGFQDKGEEGIPGVRLASVRGLLIETDGYGRYHIPDVDTGRRGLGKNFTLKLDTTTLPEGSRLTTENPRVLRLTGTALNKINFGVRLPVEAAEAVPEDIASPQAQSTSQPTKKTRTAKRVVVALDGSFFDQGRSSIRADQVEGLNHIAASIKKYGRATLIIDDVQAGRKLATYRANTLKFELQKRLGSKLMRDVEIKVGKE